MTFCVKGIFQVFLWKTAEIVGVYAGFSPVRPDGNGSLLLPLVFELSMHNYILCVSSLSRCFPIRHIFTPWSML